MRETLNIALIAGGNYRELGDCARGMMQQPEFAAYNPVQVISLFETEWRKLQTCYRNPRVYNEIAKLSTPTEADLNRIADTYGVSKQIAPLLTNERLNSFFN